MPVVSAVFVVFVIVISVIMKKFPEVYIFIESIRDLHWIVQYGKGAKRDVKKDMKKDVKIKV